MSRARFLEILRGALHQIGVPMEEATTAGYNKLRRFMPTLANVLRLEDPDLQAVGSWVEIPAGGGPNPAKKSRATWLMGRHYAGGQTERSASVKRAILQRFWRLFHMKKGELALTDGHLLPRGSWTWQELAATNDTLEALENVPVESGAIEVEDMAELAQTELGDASRPASPVAEAHLDETIHADDSSSTTSTSASDVSAYGSDVEGLVSLDSAVEQAKWIQQGSKTHIVKATDDSSRPIPWCRDFAFQQDPKSDGVGFGTTSKQAFCQRCLARMPRGIYVAVAAQGGWMHRPLSAL